MLSTFWSMAVIPANLLLRASILFWEPLSRLPNAVNSTPLLLSLNVGSLNGLSPGLKNAVDFGKIANVNSTQACKWSPSPSSLCSSKDHEQALIGSSSRVNVDRTGEVTQAAL